MSSGVSWKCEGHYYNNYNYNNHPLDRIKAIFTFKDVHSENMSCKLSERIISVPDSAELTKHARQIAEGSLNDMISISRHLVHKA